MNKLTSWLGARFVKLKPGDRAIWQNSSPAVNGLEVIVVEGCAERLVIDHALQKEVLRTTYLVRLVDDNPYLDETYAPYPHQLTRAPKKPSCVDRNHIVSWHECAWEPSRGIR